MTDPSPMRPTGPAAPLPRTAMARRRRALLATVLVLALLVALGAWAVRRDSGSTGPAAKAWTLEPYEGLGTWVDAFDWSHALGGDAPPVGEDDMRAMADLGIQTVYLQTSHLGASDDVVLESSRLEGLIRAAHRNGLSVVAWYLPGLEDVDADMERLKASAKLDVDGLAVDIESVKIDDIDERNARLLELDERIRETFDDKPIGGITLSAVHLQEVNRSYWPDYPWKDIGRTYDVILPMAYWSIRLPEWRDGNRYVGENIDRIRDATGDPEIPIHVVGGLAEDATIDHVKGMLEAMDGRTEILGGSLYDWATATPGQWAALAPLRDRNPAGAGGTAGS